MLRLKNVQYIRDVYKQKVSKNWQSSTETSFSAMRNVRVIDAKEKKKTIKRCNKTT